MKSIIGLQGQWSDGLTSVLEKLSRWNVVPFETLAVLPQNLKARVEVLVTTSTQPVDAQTLAGFTGLKVHLRAASGEDNVDVGFLDREGVWHRNFPEPFANTTAQVTVSLLLACLCRLPFFHNLIVSRQWQRPKAAVSDLSTLTIGIVGFGFVGSRVYRFLKPLARMLLVSDPYQESHVFRNPEKLPLSPSQFVSFEDVLSESDGIVFCVRGKPQGSLRFFPVFSRQHLSRVRSGVCLVNTSRADVFEAHAIEEGLKTGVLGTCGFDVWWEEPPRKDHWLFECKDQLIVTPHIGSRSALAQKKMEHAIQTAIESYTVSNRL